MRRSSSAQLHDTRRSLLALVAAVACAGTEAAAPERGPGTLAATLDASHRSVFVMAAREKTRIVGSLTAAGIEVKANLLDADLTLRVTIGADQAWGACGTQANVKYALRRDNAPVLELVDKGWTGDCEGNVLDVLSARLAAALGIRTGSPPAANQDRKEE